MAAIIKEFKFDTYKFQPQTHKQFMDNAIHVDEDDIEDFINQGVHNVESKLENLDNIVESELNRIDNMDAESAANEVDRIDEEIDAIDSAFDKM